jgi:PPOX class probable F420-dependent enzyme
MPSRRDLIRMSEQEVRDFLRSRKTITINSNGPGGYPHPMPMWFAVDDDGTFRMTTFRKSQKVLNLRRDPKLTVMLESGKAYAELKGLVIEGEAEIVEDPAFTARVMAQIGQKYNGIPAPMETPRRRWRWHQARDSAPQARGRVQLGSLETRRAVPKAQDERL